MIQRVSNIEFDKWDDLTKAIDKLINSPKKLYTGLVSHHSPKYRMHGRMAGRLGYRRFLPWHRAYLIVFERMLRDLDPSLSIPYWDWIADDGQMYGFQNLVGEAKRRPSSQRGPFFASNDKIDGVLANEDYLGFAKALERLHDSGHVWVGGDMNKGRSPTDPAFWFHHAQVDRIWSKWQASNPGEMAQLTGGDAKLDPWGNEFSVAS